MNKELRKLHTLISGEDYKIVNLSDNLFKKEVAKLGKYVDPFMPDQKMNLNREWAEQLVANFDSKIVHEIIPVPVTHTNDPEKNAGEVVALSIEGNKLMAVLNIRREEIAEDIRNGLIFDVSISFDFDYIDTKKGERHGPALLHVALVNNPFIKKMSKFKELSEAINSVFEKEFSFNAIMLSEDNSNVESKELTMTTVKNEHNFDVELTYTEEGGSSVTVGLAAGTEIEVPETAVEDVKRQLSEAEAPQDEEEKSEDSEESSEESSEGSEESKEDSEEDSEEESSEEDSEEESKEDKPELSDSDKKDAKIAELERKLAFGDAEKQFSELLKEGKVVPAQKEQIIALLSQKSTEVSLSSDSQLSLSEAVYNLLKAGKKQVDFEEKGTETDDDSSVSQLSEAQKAYLSKVGASVEDFEKYGNSNLGLLKRDNEEE